MIEKILLTGFEPFGSHTTNISGEAATRLDGTVCEGFQISSLVLPVQLEQATARLEEAIASAQPAAVLCCGIHDGEGAPFRVELAAKNERHYPMPDNAGQAVTGATVEDDGPAMVFSSLPIGAIKLGLDDAGLETQLSEDAGRYLCNAIFYWIARRRKPAGFLHVPADPALLGEVSRAMQVAVEVTAKRLIAERVEATA